MTQVIKQNKWFALTALILMLSQLFLDTLNVAKLSAQTTIWIGAIAKQTIQQPSKFIVSFDSGNSEVNPKDFTAGEVKIWAVCQKFPF